MLSYYRHPYLPLTATSCPLSEQRGSTTSFPGFSPCLFSPASQHACLAHAFLARWLAYQTHDVYTQIYTFKGVDCKKEQERSYVNHHGNCFYNVLTD